MWHKKITKFFDGPYLVMLAASLWAADGIWRRSLYHLPPIIIVFMEHLIGSLLLIPYAKELLQVKFTTKIFLLTGLISLLGGLLGTLFITTALAKVSFIAFSVVLLIQKTQPIFAIASATVLLREKISRQFIGWAILAFIAAYFVTFPLGYINFATGQQTIIAALFSLGAAFCWGTGTTISKMLLQEVNHVQGTILRFWGSTLWAGLALLFLRQSHNLVLIGQKEIMTLIIIAFSTGLLAMWIYYKGLKKITASASTLLELTFPALAIIIDAVMYHTVLSVWQYLAVVILIFAIVKIGQLEQKTSETK